MICVDELTYYPSKPYGYDYWAHMWSDTDDLDELHFFARKLVLRKEWAQIGPKHRLLPHYDITRSKHELALLEGAVLTDLKAVMLERLEQSKSKQSS